MAELVSDELVNEVKTLLIELIRNQAVNHGTSGSETKNAETIAKYWDSKGLSGMYRFLEKTKGRANLLAEYSSGQEGPTVIFGPSHYDVVPVPDADQWTHPPFEAKEADGHIWGRGAIDMLYIVAAQAVTFAHLVVNKSSIAGTLRCMFVADEEAGGANGAGFIANEHPELIKADFALGEMGGVQYHGGTGQYLFGVAEKGVVFIRLSFKGRSGHASMPMAADNALVKLTEAMTRLAKYQPPPEVQSTWTEFIKAVGLPWFRRMLASNSLTLPSITRTLHNEGHPLATMMHSLTTMTISPTVISSSSSKTNVIPDAAEGEIDFRTLPGQDVEYVRGQIRKAIGEELWKEATVETIITSDPNLSPFEGDKLWESLKRILPQIVPNAEPVPFMAPGGTDLRFLRKNGVSCFGIGLCDDELDLPGILKLYHSRNERVSIRTLQLTSTMLHHLLADLMSAKAGGGPGASFKSALMDKLGPAPAPLGDVPAAAASAAKPPVPEVPRQVQRRRSETEREARHLDLADSEDEEDARYESPAAARRSNSLPKAPSAPVEAPALADAAEATPEAPAPPSLAEGE